MTSAPQYPASGALRARLHAVISDLARISVSAGRGITREVFTPEYEQACELVAEFMREAGLEVETDAFGNLRGRLRGSEPDAPVVLTGSHVDTTLDAGAYDGVLGVLGGIVAVGELAAAGVELRHSIVVIALAGEEPRFGSGCLGSRALMAQLSRSDLDTMTDRDGVSLAAALRASGLDPDALSEAEVDPARIRAFIELHIEQGAVLEAAGLPIGVVHRIAAPHDLRVTLTGRATHAGATPMHLRNDAFAGAAEGAMLLERLALESDSDVLVATVGVIEVKPGAINVVPGEVVFEADIRDSDLESREQVIAAFRRGLADLAARRDLSLTISTITEDSPANCDPLVVDAVTEACRTIGVPSMPMVSGAYHDAMIIGQRAPMGMIFVPSRDGLSHHPDEYTAPDEIDLGVDVLREALATLAAGEP